ncbi:MAG: methylmalonyl-CoA epimerase [Saprospiraceae bacterium]
MIGKIEHIGIAVKDLSSSQKIYETLLNTPAYKREVVESEFVETLFFRSGVNKIELLQSLHEDSAIHKFIQKKGEGIHHIAFEVDDIYSEMQRLKDEGFILINDEPKKGADNKLICFLHPKTTHGVLIELCQEIKVESI